MKNINEIKKFIYYLNNPINSWILKDKNRDMKKILNRSILILENLIKHY